MWLSVDPLAEKYPDHSPYEYCFSNPLIFTDPTGMEGESIHLDKYGNVLKNIDDGDNGVYLHANAKCQADVNKNYSKDNTGAGGKNIGEIGGTIDANTIYKNTLTRNITEAENIYSPFTFKDNVKNGGKWDLKNNEKTIFGLANDGKTKFSFEGGLMESQDIGNHHFGAVGKAYGLFTEEFMLKQAGEAQVKAGTSNPQWQKYKTVRVPVMIGDRVIWKNQKESIAPYGDDPRDQSWIKAGFQYYKNNKK